MSKPMTQSWMRQCMVRLLAVAMCVFCLQKAWAGVYLYQGLIAYRAGEYESGASALERGLSWDPENPKIRNLLGQSIWYDSISDQDVSGYREVGEHFEWLTKTFPEYGKGWIFRAKSFLRVHEAGGQKLSVEQWNEVLPWFEKAVSLEFGNAWTHYQVGKLMLLHDSFLNGPDRGRALDLMRMGIAIHYSNTEYPHLEKPSPLLEPALPFLWHRYHDIDLLMQVTPQNRESYKVLLQFLSKENLYSFYPGIDALYLAEQEKDYVLHCKRGEQLLDENKIRDAYRAFRKAFWMRSWAYPWAKAGILVTDYHRNKLGEGKHELFKEDYREVLRRILEDEDDTIGTLLPSLKLVAKESGDPYLQGLQALRSGAYKNAVRYLEQTENQKGLRRYYLARAYEGAGQREEALSVLSGALEETDPDLRELLLLNEWGVKGALEKIRSAPFKYPAKSWWQENSGRRTIRVNVRPGLSIIKVFVRSEAEHENEPALLKFLINGKPIQTVTVDSKQWKPVQLLTSNPTGGKRWLQVEGTGSLGPVRVDWEAG